MLYLQLTYIGFTEDGAIPFAQAEGLPKERGWYPALYEGGTYVGLIWLTDLSGKPRPMTSRDLARMRSFYSRVKHVSCAAYGPTKEKPQLEEVWCYIPPRDTFMPPGRSHWVPIPTIEYRDEHVPIHYIPVR